VCVLHSIGTNSVCSAQSRESLYMYFRVWSSTLFVMHSLERYCVCNAQCRKVLCVYCTV